MNKKNGKNEKQETKKKKQTNNTNFCCMKKNFNYHSIERRVCNDN